MARKLWFVAAAVLVIAGAAVLYGTQRDMPFDAEKILAQSKLNGRTFKGKVVKIGALDGKITAYLMEEHSVPLAAISFGFARAGRAYEPKEGVALLAESVLLDGAGGLSRQALREMMKEKGIKLDVSATRDRLEFSLSYVKQFEKEALEALKAVLYAPQLDARDLDVARRQLAALKKQQSESPQRQLGDLVKKNFYGDHPYGREDIPAAEMLEAVNADDIRAYLKSFAGKDNLAVGIAGDMDKAEAEAFLAQAFGALSDTSAGKALPNFSPAAVHVQEPSEISAQSFVLTVSQGVKRLDKDFYPLYIADYVFGGAGLMSRLSKAVREKEGLTYGIYSYLSNSDAADLWQIYFSATPENVAEIMKLTSAEYADFYEKGISAEELAQAKKSLTASFNLRFASLLNIAEMLKLMQVQELGADFLERRQELVQAVTLDEANAAIKRRMPAKLEPDAGVSLFQIEGVKK